MQYLYFNESADLMIERLNFNRVYLYKKIQIDGSSYCKWEKVS